MTIGSAIVTSIGMLCGTFILTMIIGAAIMRMKK
jgi:hypothetical protein